MDLFTPLLPKTGYINSLPSFFFIIPLDYFFYLTVIASVFLLFRFPNKYTTKLILSVWFLASILYLVQTLVQLNFESKVFGGKSLEMLRDITTADGYYPFLKFVQQNIPSSTSVALFLPANLNYFRQKSPYFLYPNYISDDAKYILVFKAKHVKFDENTGNLFVEGKPTIGNVSLLAKYDSESFILERK